jgi:hypothetical protein
MVLIIIIIIMGYGFMLLILPYEINSIYHEFCNSCLLDNKTEQHLKPRLFAGK